MVFSAIDVGSNTLRLLVAEVSASGIRPLRYDRVITRLAGGIGESRQLGSASVEKSIAALNEFSRIINDFSVARSWCAGTSALREARNSREFIERARRDTGLEIEVISGEKEAQLTANGVLSAVKESPSFVIIDIGGGSIEVVYRAKDGGIGHITVPAGVVKMADAHMRSNPPSGEDIRAIRGEAEGISKNLKERIANDMRGNAVLIGTAGTINTLAAIDLGLERFDPAKVHAHKMPRSRLVEMADFLSALPLSKRAEVKGLEPERADLIIPGINLTISLMKALNFNEILVSSAGLLEGMVLELYERSPGK